MQTLTIPLVAVLCFMMTAVSDPATPESEMTVRAFRALSMARPLAVQVCVEMSDGVDQATRAEVARQIDGIKREVEARIERFRGTQAPPNSLIEQSTEFMERFQAATYEKWMKDAPETRAAVKRSTAILMAITGALSKDKESLVRAAEAAGLPDSQHGEAKKIAEDAAAVESKCAERLSQLEAKLNAAQNLADHQMESMAVMGETELQRFRDAKSTREKLRALVPASNHAKFDDELLKLASGR